jgi:peroxiredoxin
MTMQQPKYFLGLLLASVLCFSASAFAATAAPEFSLPGRSGQTVTLSAYRGDVVMINFWASWCKPCRQELPLLEQMYQRYKNLGFTLIGVNVDEDQKNADLILKNIPVSFPIAYDQQDKVSNKYGLEGMPNTVFVDRNGNIRHVHTGYTPGDEQGYDEQIRLLIRE